MSYLTELFYRGDKNSAQNAHISLGSLLSEKKDVAKLLPITSISFVKTRLIYLAYVVGINVTTLPCLVNCKYLCMQYFCLKVNTPQPDNQ